jgi:transposase
MQISKEVILHSLEYCEKCGAHHPSIRVKYCSVCGALQEASWIFLALYSTRAWRACCKEVGKAKEEHCLSSREGFQKHRLWKMFRRTSANPNRRWNFCPICGEKLE